MQAHADGKGEMTDNRQHLARGILPLQHRGPLSMGHLRHDRMTVLGIKHSAFHGHEHEVSVEASGYEFRNLRGRLGDTARACRALWRDAPASFASDTVSFTDLWCVPRPTRPSGVPMWFGAPLTDGNLALIVETGAGWLPLGKNWTVDDTAAGVERLRAAFVAAGRDPGELGVRAVLFPVLDDDGRGRLDATLEEGLPPLAAAGVTSASLGLRFFADGSDGVRPFFEELNRRWDALGRSVAS
jgi:alkanesulfonate monooxygenase SsuD/methylene tetrahydromethanopterin reductase-like flavin-dependent oxidoreductase (luciferase family)